MIYATCLLYFVMITTVLVFQDSGQSLYWNLTICLESFSVTAESEDLCGPTITPELTLTWMRFLLSSPNCSNCKQRILGVPYRAKLRHPETNHRRHHSDSYKASMVPLVAHPEASEGHKHAYKIGKHISACKIDGLFSVALISCCHKEGLTFRDLSQRQTMVVVFVRGQ